MEIKVYATLRANPYYWNKGYPKISKLTFVQNSPKKATTKKTKTLVILLPRKLPLVLMIKMTFSIPSLVTPWTNKLELIIV